MKIKIYFLTAIILVAFLAASCSGTDKAKVDTGKSQEVANPYAFEDIVVKLDMDIPDCNLRQLENRMIFVTSPHCPHCKKALPIMERLVKERGLGGIYENVDAASEEGRDVLAGAGLQVQYVPTLILDCKAYVGGSHVQNYENILPKRGAGL